MSEAGLIQGQDSTYTMLRHQKENELFVSAGTVMVCNSTQSSLHALWNANMASKESSSGRDKFVCSAEHATQSS